MQCAISSTQWVKLKNPRVAFVQQAQRAISSHEAKNRGQGTGTFQEKKKKIDTLLDVFDAIGWGQSFTNI